MQLTFLGICQRAYREGGLTGTLTTTVNQTGRAADVVRWAQEAYEEVQHRRPDWNADWGKQDFPLSANVDTYDPAGVWGVAGGIRNIEKDGAYVYKAASGLASRQFLQYTEWATFRQMVAPPVSGFPTCYTLAPDGTVHYFPMPQEALLANHEYWKHPQQLALDADIPRIGADFHMAIVWKAAMRVAEDNRDWVKFDYCEEHYEGFMSRMTIEQTPQYTVGDSLA